MNNVTPKKPFDITKHGFSSDNVRHVMFDYGYLNFNFNTRASGFFLSRDDAIAIAKAYDLTGDDL